MRIRRHKPVHISRGVLPFTVAVLLVLGASSCNGDAPSAESTTTPSSPVTTAAVTTTSVVPGSPEDKAAVTATLDRYWAAAEKSQNSADPNLPELLAVVRGAALERDQQVSRLLQQRKQTRRSRNGVPPHASKVMSADAISATAWECVIDDSITSDQSGAEIDKSVWSYTFDTSLERSGSDWLIVNRTTTAREQGRGLCEMLPQQ
jgi:hypothetical protein